MPSAVADPLPLRGSELRALVAVTLRELARGRWLVAREIAAWRRAAQRIPCAEIRADALEVLRRKRGNTDGAALFWTLAQRRPQLLRLLVAHEIIWDFLDCVHERLPEVGNGVMLHRALVDSLDPRLEPADYYRGHPWHDDGGYLRALVATCRRCLAYLPAYEAVRPLVVREGARGAVQALNHVRDPAARDAALERWAQYAYPGRHDVAPFELTAAASAPLATYALLALAAAPGATGDLVAGTFGAYFPWVSLSTVLLDSYTDIEQDACTGGHSYLAHYADMRQAIDRLCEAVGRALRAVARLPNGERHAVVVACMVAMYLSKDSVRTPERRATTSRIAAAGGALTRTLVPILRLWRIRYAQQAA